MDTSWKRTACPYDCPDECGILARTDGKTILQVKGDPLHPVTRGFLCRKMNHYEKTIHHPDRLITPLRRKGPKGSGEFLPISWEEALEEISSKWKSLISEYGAECILPYSYSGSEHLIANQCGQAFFHAIGASRLIDSICCKGKDIGFDQILGSTPGQNSSSLSHSDFIIIWGCNVTATWIHAHTQILKAKKKGAKVILIETYETLSSCLADEVILVKPGTDSALALSVAFVLKEQGLCNMDFLNNYTLGACEFLSSLDAYDPRRTQNITGVSPETVERLAIAYSRAKCSQILFGAGMSRHGNGAMTVRCIAALPALTGAFMHPHGGFIGNISTGKVFDKTQVTRPDFLKKPVRWINMNQLGSALLDQTLNPPVKSLYVYNSNPACVASNQAQVLEGLQRDDLFTVVHERFLTDTAKYADIILPADMSVEHADLVTPYGSFVVQQTQKLIDPPGEAKSNWDTFCLLAKAMGIIHPFFSMTNEEIKERILSSPTEILNTWSQEDWKKFRQGYAVSLKLPDSLDFKTPSKKIEFLRPDLSFPLPCYQPNHGGNYPLKLVAAPSAYTLNSTFNERKDLTEKRGPMCLLINPKDAQKRGIHHMDTVYAYNDLARVLCYASLTEAVPCGTVIAEGVYTTQQALDTLTFNALFSERLTDAGEGSTYCDNTIEMMPSIS